VSVGYLPHSFDLFNVAHLDLIAVARTRCDRLVLAVLDDDAVQERTGRPPVVPLVERLEIVANVRGVDSVVVHDETADRGGSSLLVAEDELAAWPADAVGLPAGRTSSSPVLRHALRPLNTEAVA
jgi:Cytidylyltransferase-like